MRINALDRHRVLPVNLHTQSANEGYISGGLGEIVCDPKRVNDHRLFDDPIDEAPTDAWHSTLANTYFSQHILSQIDFEAHNDSLGDIEYEAEIYYTLYEEYKAICKQNKSMYQRWYRGGKLGKKPAMPNYRYMLYKHRQVCALIGIDPKA